MTSTLTTLPPEIQILIFSYLPNSTIKKLRLTCSVIRNTALLNVERVFLSIHKRDIEVFCCIASHETLRLQVKELIWDDGAFSPAPIEDVLEREGHYVGAVTGLHYDKVPEERRQKGSPTYCPRWFTQVCDENLERLAKCEYELQTEAGLEERMMETRRLTPPAESWETYKGYFLDQAKVIASGEDVEALKLGLERFPALRKVRIIPTAHDKLFLPLYRTPNIRSMPYAFNYAMPEAWVSSLETTFPIDANLWDEEVEEYLKDQWRGFRIVTKALAEQAGKHSVSELIVDPCSHKTGINYHIFNGPCRELSDFTTILEQPGFKRLDLPLFVGGRDDSVWPPFKDSHYHSALSRCADLEHFSFRTDRGIFATENLSMEHFTSLLSLFPIDKWSKLRHFTLSSIPVVQSDILDLLAAMPSTLRTVELSQLLFISDRENYRSLLTGMRDTLDWKQRAVEDRPQVTFWVKKPSAMLNAYMEQAVNRYLYDDGENPMQVGPGREVYFSG
ncbi:hypothetical protein MGYG_08112 [Nannizzia gypsea CBS 118893]|uniref:F-box domain-containing protein n=1 Tax=Arthroderma gypseum (strain ATCC MYA-4604 / CBS 118893) TaxID=535722 RepID=E4V529_ARTGP|nr:hypothetical protein MGYG_08112 [Nannizzia gypsea CBS 118893]EFR05103.1 hypothetical protein MGYG_08112 [Nannizzia gypsea CBS 118893]